jgi:nicotinate-nucleotide pyrophosphorylase (carboxylating)
MDWNSHDITNIIEQSLHEDVGNGDITSATLFTGKHPSSATFLAKQDGVLAGLPLVARIFKMLSRGAKVVQFIGEGESLIPGREICRVSGDIITLLSGERVALNFLQRLSGIATQTAVFVALAGLHGITVLDTRKTTPLLRKLEKYAVEVGGGTNHRFGLFDQVLVKDNHLKSQPDFGKILAAFQAKGIPPGKVEVEVTTLEQLHQALDAGVQWFLLDNMTPSTIRKAVKMKRNNSRYEVSGGVTIHNFSAYLIHGIDAISIGALTHSVKSLDISMELD